MSDKNFDENVISGFGDEWERFDQSNLSAQECSLLFDRYFKIFPWFKLDSDSVGADIGCGSGRWAQLVAPKVGLLHCFDPSDALEVAKRNLDEQVNCKFHKKSIDRLGLDENSLDFAYSLGVLHHIPDTQAGLNAIAKFLKPGAPFLVYLYYALDNRPFWFRLVWKISNVFRLFISRLPYSLRYFSSQLIAIFIYFPLAWIAYIFEKIGVDVRNFPLSSYRNVSFYTMRTDSLDRFGTRLEKRFSKEQIERMMIIAGFDSIQFSESEPFWCAVGFKNEK